MTFISSLNHSFKAKGTKDRHRTNAGHVYGVPLALKRTDKDTPLIGVSLSGRGMLSKVPWIQNVFLNNGTDTLVGRNHRPWSNTISWHDEVTWHQAPAQLVLPS